MTQARIAVLMLVSACLDYKPDMPATDGQAAAQYASVFCDHLDRCSGTHTSGCILLTSNEICQPLDCLPPADHPFDRRRWIEYAICVAALHDADCGDYGIPRECQGWWK